MTLILTWRSLSLVQTNGISVYGTIASSYLNIQVPILTQPEGQVLRWFLTAISGQIARFQSSPSPKARCDGVVIHSLLLICSNPHPARRPGAALKQNLRCDRRVVPILTQPEGQVLRWTGQFPILSRHCSNPHPARRPGAAGRYGEAEPLYVVPILTQPEGQVLRLISSLIGSDNYGSNPHPARRPGAAIKRPCRKIYTYCSNPHPARRPGAA